jgi:hypothetical protein
MIAHGLGRRTGTPRSLTPRYGPTDTRGTGVLHLLPMALRVWTLLEGVVRRQVEQAGNAVQGLDAGNPQRATARPTAASIVRAFRGLTLGVQEGHGHVSRRLSPLSPLQQRLLQLLGWSVDTYL